MQQQDLFVSGQDGYHTYRIPAILVTRGGTVLTFCEGRKNGGGDAGDIDVLLRRSFDNGQTWEPYRVIADDGTNTIGNPCPVQDRETGTIWLLLCRNLEEGHEKDILAGKSPREVFVMKSDDEGETWTRPQNITPAVKRPEWTWYATGPCHGIQLQSGRLLVPCNHAVYDAGLNQSGPYHSHVIYSDDHGESWQIGGVVGANTNECAVAELSDGTVYINMRSYHGQNRRAFATSKDGGLTWSELELDEGLVEPVCQGSVIEDGQGGLFFSNPASVERERMTVQRCKAGSQEWQIRQVLHEGPAAYSDLAITGDGTALCFYECGSDRPYERLTLARFAKE